MFGNNTMLKLTQLAVFTLTIVVEALAITVTFSKSVFNENLREFEVEDKLAVGGSSHILKVYDEQLKLSLVLKCQKKVEPKKSYLWNEFIAFDTLGAFTDIDTTAPSTLPKVYGYGTAEGMEVLLQEYFVEGDLSTFAQRLLQYDERTRKYYYAAIGEKVMDFLIFAESRGLRQGDIKPENILIDLTVTPVRIAFIDFGNSWYINCPLETHTPGTLPYMSGRIHKVCDAAGSYATITDITLSDELESALITMALAMDLTLPWWPHHELHVKLADLEPHIDALNSSVSDLIDGLPKIQLSTDWDWEKFNFSFSTKIGEMKETSIIKNTFQAMEDQDFKVIFIQMLDHTRGIKPLEKPYEILKKAFHIKMQKHST